MSSSEPANDTVEIRVEADRDTEIFLIDSAFKCTARAIGKLVKAVEPGLYKVKFKAGPLIREVHQTVEPGKGPVEITGPSMTFASPAPLGTTGTTKGDHEDAAERLSNEVHQWVPAGSQIFVFARAWTGDGPDSGIPPVENPTRGLTLHNLRGEVLVDLEADAETQGGPEPSSGCTVELPAGTYRLRVRTEQWGALEQAVVASPGWQTQVFLWQTDDDGGTRVPDLPGASVFLAELGTGFCPDAGGVRSTELARAALLDRRAVMPRHQLERLLSSDSCNPMVAIYAAHALVAAGQGDQPLAQKAAGQALVQRTADQALVQKAAEVLTELVGQHPDVEALKLFAGEPTTYRYEAPPMLSTSWSMVEAASVGQPDIVRTGSLAARASTQLWGGGPWLTWMADDLDE